MLALKTGDLTSDPVVYEKLLSQYKDILEWKSERIHQPDSDDHIKNPASTEVSILKDTFNSKICISTINFMQEEIDNLTKATAIEGGFASTENFTCNITKPYTDIHRQVGVLHNFLNVLRNRGSIVDAPNSGKALVFSVKDLTQLTKRFTEQILRYLDGEFRIQEDGHASETEKIIYEIRHRNKEISSLKRNIESLQTNVFNLVNAQLAQKGSQLIYELDISARQLSEIRENNGKLENQIIGLVRQELQQKIFDQRQELDAIQKKFSQYRDEAASEIKADIDAKKTEALSELKGYAGKYKNISSSDTKDELNFPKAKRSLVIIQEMIRKMLTRYQ